MSSQGSRPPSRLSDNHSIMADSNPMPNQYTSTAAMTVPRISTSLAIRNAEADSSSVLNAANAVVSAAALLSASFLRSRTLNSSVNNSSSQTRHGLRVSAIQSAQRAANSSDRASANTNETSPISLSQIVTYPNGTSGQVVRTSHSSSWTSLSEVDSSRVTSTIQNNPAQVSSQAASPSSISPPMDIFTFDLSNSANTAPNPASSLASGNHGLPQVTPETTQTMIQRPQMNIYRSSFSIHPSPASSSYGAATTRTSIRAGATQLIQLAQNNWTQQRQQGLSSTSVANGVSSASVHPSFRTKKVCSLSCRFCNQNICKRGMKAILLADTRIELYSTDIVQTGRVQLVAEDYMTRNCHCRIRDVACLGCGNVVGYHVTQPCDTCMGACNNGHFWMFHSDAVEARDRMEQNGQRILVWAQLPNCEPDEIEVNTQRELVCR